MKMPHWKAILLAYRHVEELLERELGTVNLDPSLREHLSEGALDAMSRTLMAELDTLRAVLEQDLRSDDVEKVLQPFAFLVDEKVLARLSNEDAQHWPLLQLRAFGVDAGGDLFFELADTALRRPDTAPLLFEMLHFCLTAGFIGRHVGHPARLRDYREQLAARIPRPETQMGEVQTEAAPPPPTLYDFPWRYYAVTVSIIIAVPVVLWHLSN
ncbi:DotU family type IV/VI secretion system protein [Myxococcus sp. K38C18041901]|uniref:DotU family type IV/VI secretion system protein n=1 Tax=Myxococcus guangdongensis TaxID=2906760 RepID=UPI0020A7CA1C|nr:DotU family type IV/VI secretion system protein [Myxococcus guangdongensis]MCP3060880.1 DotU family type IV/VI secretion system protein [Myxococcus guangdongensis]